MPSNTFNFLKSNQRITPSCSFLLPLATETLCHPPCQEAETFTDLAQ